MRLGCKLNPIGQGTEMDDTGRRPSPPSLKGDATPQGARMQTGGGGQGKKTNETQMFSMSVLNDGIMFF